MSRLSESHWWSWSDGGHLLSIVCFRQSKTPNGILFVVTRVDYSSQFWWGRRLSQCEISILRASTPLNFSSSACRLRAWWMMEPQLRNQDTKIVWWIVKRLLRLQIPMHLERKERLGHLWYLGSTYLLKSKCTTCMSSEISTSTVACGRVW